MTTPSRNNYKMPEKRMIALILVVISFLMLLLPLVQVSVKLGDKSYSLSKLVDRACRYEGTTKKQFLMEMRADLSDTFMEMEEETGVHLDAKKTVKMIEKILSGKMSLLDGATLCSSMNSMVKKVTEAMSENMSELSKGERATMMTLEDASKSTTAASIVLWFMVIVLLGTFVFAIISLLQNQKTGVIAFLAAIGLLLLGSLIFVGKLNSAIQDALVFAMDGLEDVLEMFGGSPYELMDQKLFHITAAPFLSLICAAAATVLMTVQIGNIKIPNNIKIPDTIQGINIGADTASWDCPACGAKNRSSSRFCPHCGQSRPQ